MLYFLLFYNLYFLLKIWWQVKKVAKIVSLLKHSTFNVNVDHVKLNSIFDLFRSSLKLNLNLDSLERKSLTLSTVQKAL